VTLDEDIITALHASLDFQKPTQRRRRAIDHTVAARRARRKGNLGAVAYFYNEAVLELKKSSNDKAHRAIRMMEGEVVRLRYAGHG
tara:strand:+ start:258 stop:515 length:258 start_codon:yes stop_codon:yes gene_type:complete